MIMITGSLIIIFTAMEQWGVSTSMFSHRNSEKSYFFAILHFIEDYWKYVELLYKSSANQDLTKKFCEDC